MAQRVKVDSSNTRNNHARSNGQVEEEDEQSQSSSFITIFTLFLVIHLIAISVNHIDDTDETYGYWEPLHYLLFGHGMQTWEYAPEYSIRTYAFLFPMYVLGVLLSWVSPTKLFLFQCIRGALGLMNAYVNTRFVLAIEQVFGKPMMRMCLVFMMTSPGMFYTSTSFLPSSFTMTMVMVSVTSWLQHRFYSCLFFGCIAVLWSGWPFVGVILIPLGLHMLVTTTSQEGWKGLVRLVIMGAIILIGVGLPPLLIDSWLYGKITSPSLNILLYNAIGGNGDELYGVEPASYYIRNLILNLGPSVIFACLSPVAILIRIARVSMGIELEWEEPGRIFKIWTLLGCVGLWLGLLFSRPHKEERFMYPAYPLLCLAGSTGFTSILSSFHWLIDAILGTQEQQRASRDDSRPKSYRIVNILLHLIIAAVVLVSALLGAGRVISNYKNYHGILELWSDLSWNTFSQSAERTQLSLSQQILHQSPVVKHTLHAAALRNVLPPSVFASIKAREVETNAHLFTICTAGEWYLFPSHFFLPDNMRLGYVEGTFHGLLPRYFPATEPAGADRIVLGTSMSTDQDFNGLNQEVRSRYLKEEQCDAFVVLLNSTSYESHEEPNAWLSNKKKLNAKKVLDAAKSTSSLARAYFIPNFSAKRNIYREYALVVESKVTV